MRVVVDTNVFVSAALKAASIPAVAVQLAANYHQILKIRIDRRGINAGSLPAKDSRPCGS